MTQLKDQVREFWTGRPCGIDVATSPRYTRGYFDEIEAYRYAVEPEILSFAQFTRWHGRDVLEVGVGAGTDFLQWVRAGARARGVDLTEEGVRHVRERLALYGLAAEEVRVADAEQLPYEDESFDLVYSWGVIHHSPDTLRALEEILRVLRVGGTAKIMIYNRHSLSVYYKWIYYALLRGRPHRGLRWVLHHHQESIGTKGYTLGEVRRLLARYPVRVRTLTAPATWKYDLLRDRPLPFRVGASILAAILGRERCGFFLAFEVEKVAPYRSGDGAAVAS
jgi:SAM-dependent methyltransferase